MELNEKTFVVTTDEESLNITQTSNANPLFTQPQKEA